MTGGARVGGESVALRFVAVRPAAAECWPGALDFAVPTGVFAVVETPAALAGLLLRLSAGLVAPATGRVEVLGVEPTRLTRVELQRFRRVLGVGLQPGGLMSNLTLKMNLVVPLLYSGAADLERASRRADTMLASFGVTRWAAARPADVAPDVRAQAVIARALVREPELLLLDDPVSLLPPARAEEALELCRAQARTLLITTPQPNALLEHRADLRVTWTEAGLRRTTYEVGTN
jgi:phospholipid/cholesterol/gamma-HCH transport system ATP-binding protein